MKRNVEQSGQKRNLPLETYQRKWNGVLRVCPSNPSLRGKGAAGRCEAAGSKKPEAYSLEYVEDVFGPRTTQMPADRLPQ
jgi:hypothetical protein